MYIEYRESSSKSTPYKILGIIIDEHLDLTEYSKNAVTKSAMFVLICHVIMLNPCITDVFLYG